MHRPGRRHRLAVAIPSTGAEVPAMRMAASFRTSRPSKTRGERDRGRVRSRTGRPQRTGIPPRKTIVHFVRPGLDACYNS